MNPESARLAESRDPSAPWRRWGPYLSERQWGTVREDYSDNGDAWRSFTHDQARSRAYRWGEDGLAGICDERQRLCFALALWNGRDPIIKERLFGLDNGEGNHGEDVKEYYFYLDSTPTHSYMKYLYKYPQSAYPYDDLVGRNRERGRHDPEYELIETGAFDEGRYFDVFVEYAKATPEDVLIRITVHNRGPEAAALRVLPTLWFRDQWSWQPKAVKPSLSPVRGGDPAMAVVHAVEAELGDRYLYCEGAAPLLFTENATNTRRLHGRPNATPYVKDGINDHVVHGKADAVNPDRVGTKVAADYALTVPAGGSRVVRLRLSDAAPAGNGSAGAAGPLGASFEKVFATRRREADEFYATVIPGSLNADAANVMRQALAGMLWSKQFYHYDVDRWLAERGSNRFRDDAKVSPRNDQWHHMWNGGELREVVG